MYNSRPRPRPCSHPRRHPRPFDVWPLTCAGKGYFLRGWFEDRDFNNDHYGRLVSNFPYTLYICRHQLDINKVSEWCREHSILLRLPTAPYESLRLPTAPCVSRSCADALNTLRDTKSRRSIQLVYVYSPPNHHQGSPEWLALDSKKTKSKAIATNPEDAAALEAEEEVEYDPGHESYAATSSEYSQDTNKVSGWSVVGQWLVQGVYTYLGSSCFTHSVDVTRRYTLLHVVTRRYTSLHFVTRRYTSLHIVTRRYTSPNPQSLPIHRAVTSEASSKRPPSSSRLELTLCDSV